MVGNREKLVELVYSALCKNIGFSCNLAENIADHLLANGVTVQQWISVKDGLPDIKKDGELIQITQTVQATDGKETFFGRFKVFKYDGSWMFVCVNEDVDLCVIDEITHWQPLPEPTKEKLHEKH